MTETKATVQDVIGDIEYEIKDNKYKLNAAIRNIERFHQESQRMIDRIKVMSDIEIYKMCTNSKIKLQFGTLRLRMPLVIEACQIIADTISEPQKQPIYAKRS